MNILQVLRHVYRAGSGDAVADDDDFGDDKDDDENSHVGNVDCSYRRNQANRKLNSKGIGHVRRSQ